MSKRYKLVFCTQNMAPFRMRWIDELAKEFDVHVYHLNEYAPGVNMNYINYIPTRAKVYCAKKKIWKRNFFDIKRIVDENADVYLLDGYGFIGQQHLIWELGRKKIPFIISVDGGFIREEESYIKRTIKAYFMKKANSFLSTSYETDKFIKHYVGDDINLYRHFFSSVQLEDICTGLNIEKKQVFRDELKIEKKFTIVAVGQFIPRKGFDVLIEAIKLLEVDIQVYFIGATDVKLYKEIIDKNIKEKVHFVPFCNTSTLDKYYIASDVFVLPTREDVWGLVVGEAMAKGLPVITTNKCLAGLEMIRDGENGFVVAVENVQELADKILFLYENPQICIEMSKNNIAVMREYTIEEATKIDVKNLKEWIENE